MNCEVCRQEIPAERLEEGAEAVQLVLHVMGLVDRG